MYRQGDILIIPIQGDPEKRCVKKTRDKGRVILAYGEVTGHAHAIKDKNTHLWKAPDGSDILTIERETDLTHEEHKPIKLPKGKYRVVKQREYNPWAETKQILVED